MLIERDYLRACAQDLQRQLDDERARHRRDNRVRGWIIASVAILASLLVTAAYAERHVVTLAPGDTLTVTVAASATQPTPEPETPAAPPLVKIEQLPKALRVSLPEPASVDVKVWIRSKASSVLLGTIPAGQTKIPAPDELFTGKPPVSLVDGWELWAWAVVGEAAGVETRHVVKLSSEPVEPLPIPNALDVPAPPADAIRAVSVDHAIRLLDQNRVDGRPILIEGLTFDVARLPDRQLSLWKCRNVWIGKNTFHGDGRSFADSASPIFVPDGSSNIHVYQNTFRDMPGSCAIWFWFPKDSTVVGNTFKNVRQPLHAILRRGAANFAVKGNRGEGVTRIAIEIQSHGFTRANAFQTTGVEVRDNFMECIVGGEIVYSLACPSARDMIVDGNVAMQPAKGSPQDANPSHGGIGYGFEVFAGTFTNNRVVGSTVGYVLEGDAAPWGANIATSNSYTGSGRRIGYQNGGDRNTNHRVE